MFVTWSDNLINSTVWFSLSYECLNLICDAREVQCNLNDVTTKLLDHLNYQRPTNYKQTIYVTIFSVF